MNRIRVVVKQPGEPAEVREIENTLEAFQAIVGGRLEAVYLGDSLHMYIDDEGNEIDLSLSDTVRMQNFCNRNAVEHFC